MSVPPNTINTNPTIHSIADRIKTGQITRIITSTTKTALPGSNLPHKLLLPLPEPFYAIARARHPTTLKPTLSHAFLALLAKKNILHFLFTQNIDGLEEDAGVPAEKILWTHGNWKSQHCYKCKAEYPDDLMQKAINASDVPYCLAPKCGGAIKPDVVFFGQSLPKEFDEKVKLIPEADLMLVMGTSLRVAPYLVIWGIGMGMFVFWGIVMRGVCEFAEALGWRDELEVLWKEAVAAKAKIDGGGGGGEDGPDLDACIAKMAAQMDERLGISKGHKKMLENHLGDKFAKMMAEGEAVFVSHAQIPDYMPSTPAGTDGEIALLYSTTSTPANTSDECDIAMYDEFLHQPPGITVEDGTVFRMIDLQPGKVTPMHRTVSLDYGIVLEGAVDLVLDSGEVRRLGRGGCLCSAGNGAFV
ncbi:Sirtuin family [Penicillium waksmanii]|uniref:Sirtuin family n=1 Tax=Penicillium waksmanii TaxID=69791 RepID=UPI0025491343|nr:Sirtuin family [Penicillium waksmanii]KAJ5979796.1 Sirtuin family [Penicillium waksmanii]